MAKVGFWLRGARGKLAGSVLMKGEKGTVARENVAPKNPKTRSQAVQRAIFATISKTAAAIDPVIRSSFDGFTNGKNSRREFVRVNNEILRNNYGSSVAYLLPKGSVLNAPNALKISSGKLGLIEAPVPTDIGSVGGALKVLPLNVNKTQGGITLSDLQAVYPFIKPGSQLTFVCCAGAIDVKEDYKWYYGRIVLGTWVKPEDRIIDIGELTIPATVLDTSKTEGMVLTDDGSVSFDTDRGILSMVTVDVEGGTENYLIFGNPNYDLNAICGGLIVSNYDSDKGEWIHTESTMGVVKGDWVSNDEEAIPSYMAAARKASDSTFYTEQADNTDTTPVYYNYNEAIQVICQAYGYASKQFTFGASNSYGPIAEGDEVTIMLIPNTGVNIDAGQIRLLLGEQSVIPQITSTARGTKILKFEVPFGTAQSVTANLTFGGTWNSGVSYDNAAIRVTISKVQG